MSTTSIREQLAALKQAVEEQQNTVEDMSTRLQQFTSTYVPPGGNSPLLVQRIAANAGWGSYVKGTTKQTTTSLKVGKYLSYGNEYGYSNAQLKFPPSVHSTGFAQGILRIPFWYERPSTSSSMGLVFQFRTNEIGYGADIGTSINYTMKDLTLPTGKSHAGLVELPLPDAVLNQVRERNNIYLVVNSGVMVGALTSSNYEHVCRISVRSSTPSNDIDATNWTGNYSACLEVW